MGNTPVIICLRIARIDLNCPVTILNRLPVIAEAVVGKPPVVIGICIARFNINRPVTILNRLPVIAEATIGNTPVIICLRRIARFNTNYYP